MTDPTIPCDACGEPAVGHCTWAPDEFPDAPCDFIGCAKHVHEGSEDIETYRARGTPSPEVKP